MTSHADQQLRYWPTDRAWAAAGQMPPPAVSDADRDQWQPEATR